MESLASGCGRPLRRHRRLGFSPFAGVKDRCNAYQLSSIFAVPGYFEFNPNSARVTRKLSACFRQLVGKLKTSFKHSQKSASRAYMSLMM
jgi:hypothetical protein